jgi:hypothetical protein
MKLNSGIQGIPTCSLILWAAIILSSAVGIAGQSIEGFRDLKFGMTEQEVAALPVCSSSTECLYELNNKNRYVKLTYLPESVSGATESAGTSSIPKLAKITIDMGQYTDEWHQQLQMILGESYRLTQNLTQATMQSFLAEQQDELNAGYENGQVLLKVVRRPFGNLTLKVIYQNAALAAEFLQQKSASASPSKESSLE